MLNKVNAIVVFVEDLKTCTQFYRETIGLEATFSDDVSIGFRLGEQDFLLLKRSAAAAMITEAAVAQAGHSVLLCAGVEDVDTVYDALAAKGVTMLNPPKDQAWGRRTAYFADPEGNLWELFHHLPDAQ